MGVDCLECFQNPCVCGLQFKHYSKEELVSFILSTMNYKSNVDREWMLNKLFEKASDPNFYAK